MEKTPVVYKRRPRKPLSDLPPNASEAHDDHPGPELSLPTSADEDGTIPITVAKESRKSWVDRSLSNKGRHSSLIWGEQFKLSDMTCNWVGTMFGRKSKKHGKHRDQPIKKAAVVNRCKRVDPPVEFVKEKQAMFAEIDSFELESEEESPASKPRSQEWIKEYVDESKELIPRKPALEIVPEDDLEFSDCLSAALLTPRGMISNNGQNMEDPSQSSASDDSEKGIIRNLRTDSEDYGSSQISSSGIDERADDQSISSSEIVNASSRWSIGFEDEFFSARFDQEMSSLDCNLLVSGIRGLQIGEDGLVGVGGQILNSLVEEDEEENFEDTENEGPNTLPIFEALLKECRQTEPVSLRDAISNFCDLIELVKVGEGTFGEAFKGAGCVFKIVPMDGDFLVNAEAQKTSAEIYSEVLLTNTLSRLRGFDLHDSASCANYCKNFIETKAIFICQGGYEVELCLAWEEWDTTIRTSDNDHPMLFPKHQLYVVFVLADGGKDLETFVLFDFTEARSLLLQVALALGVAEAGCGFEHRDLHWGNIVLARDQENTYGHYKLLDEDLKVKTSGLSVSIIDFTLSRIDTGKHVFFCNLSADPALFEGPSRDIQSETYRRMLKLTKENWEGSFPQTNCYWIHYLADILLKKKSYRCSSQEKRALRSFCKRVLLYESAKATASDDFFRDMWIRSSE